jgi:hypothetical protein
LQEPVLRCSATTTMASSQGTLAQSGPLSLRLESIISQAYCVMSRLKPRPVQHASRCAMYGTSHIEAWSCCLSCAAHEWIFQRTSLLGSHKAARSTTGSHTTLFLLSLVSRPSRRQIFYAMICLTQ